MNNLNFVLSQKMVPAIIASLLGFSVAQVAAGFGPAPALPRPGTPNVTLSWYDAVTDHFAFDVPAGVSCNL